jgi:hypothetical protein
VNHARAAAAVPQTAPTPVPLPRTGERAVPPVPLPRTGERAAAPAMMWPGTTEGGTA